MVTDHLWFVLLAARSRAGNDRLQLADLAVLEGVGSLPEIVREAARERQFIKRVDPIRPQIVELPIGVDVRLLEGIVSPHALIDRDDVCLVVGEVVGSARQVRSLDVDREDDSWLVVYL